MVAGGVPERSVDHAKNVIEFALDMLQSLEEFNKNTSNHLQLRIGVNSGGVVAGVIGTKKINFDLWGGTIPLRACACVRVLVSEIFLTFLLRCRQCCLAHGEHWHPRAHSSESKHIRADTPVLHL